MTQSRTKRLEEAEAFLQEAVFRSRESQKGAGLWSAGDPLAADCGLGDQALVDLDLTAKAQELFRSLWPAGLAAEPIARVRAVTSDWVERQDKLDRDRNHFLKAFRHSNGFDRSAYTEEQAAAYRSGLDEVNARVDAERTRAAHQLIEASQ